MTKFTLSLLFGCLSLLGFTQQNTVSTGGEASGTGGTVSYSVGQIDYSNAQGTNGSINQGVQQPYEFYLLGIGSELTLDVSLFPNPTNEFIILQLENFTNDLKYTLSDMKGKIIATDKIETSETHIDMREYATGRYNLTIANSTTTHQTIKIIKH
ncbi:MAG: T9SS type A sorting domain-containing protein [Crocinitomicaceae bacterium]|nr:T9SS type A sorting domain-containing protein [Crocinitomicaceae bacterium]